MSKNIKVLSQHVLFKLCREAVGKASLARTLAECLYWSQHATRKIDGKPAIWKTGPELADVLGIAPKTANEHLKRLASLGFWDLKYLPRPHHPSPVTWLVFATKATAIVEAGAARLVSKSPCQSTEKCDPAGASYGASNEPHTEVQSCQNGVSKQSNTAAVQQPELQGEFIPANGYSPSSKHELQTKKQKGTGKEKAPWYSKASPEVEELVYSIQLALAARDMPPWDTSSQYAWKHAKILWGKLTEAGINSVSDQMDFVSAVLDDWPQMFKLMEWRYKNYAGNDVRPTPMALAHEFKSFKEAIYPPPPKLVEASGGGFNFSF